MRTCFIGRCVVVCAFLIGCAGSSPSAKTDNESDPESTAGTSGSTGTAGSGGSTPGTGTGGSRASGGTTGSGGKGGSTGSDGGAGTGGTIIAVDAGPSPGDGGSPAADGGSSSGDGGSTPPGAGSFPGCPRCVSLFDGKTLTGWSPNREKFDVVMDDRLNKPVMRSTGVARGFLATDKSYQDFRFIFSNRLLDGGHVQNLLLWCMRNAQGNYPNDACGGVQYQPPGRGMWDYRPGQNKTPTGKTLGEISDATQMEWSQCEMLVKGTTGEFRVACCKLTPGQGPCKGVEVLRWKDTVGMGNLKGPIAWQSHNPGHIIHWTDVHIEENPTVDDLITTK